MIPWTVRYALARYNAGQPIPSWLELAVQMTYQRGGCHACKQG